MNKFSNRSNDERPTLRGKCKGHSTKSKRKPNQNKWLRRIKVAGKWANRGFGVFLWIVRIWEWCEKLHPYAAAIVDAITKLLSLLQQLG